MGCVCVRERQILLEYRGLADQVLLDGGPCYWCKQCGEVLALIQNPLNLQGRTAVTRSPALPPSRLALDTITDPEANPAKDLLPYLRTCKPQLPRPTTPVSPRVLDPPAKPTASAADPEVPAPGFLDLSVSLKVHTSSAKPMLLQQQPPGRLPPQTQVPGSLQGFTK